MRRLLLRARTVLRDTLKPPIDRALGAIAVVVLRITRYFDPDRTANAFAAVARAIGPWFPEHKVGRANLVAAFPDKPPAEIDAILAGVWDNLGRVAAEFAHLDHIWTLDPDRLEPQPL